VGKHRLRIELPGAVAAGRFFVDQPVAGGTAFRKTQVSVLPDGRARVPLAKAGAARALGVVVYLDHAPARGEAAELEVTIDGNQRPRRRAGGWSRFYTRLQRRTPLRFQRTSSAIYLNRAGGGEVWASDPVFFRLGDDLPAGSHLVALRTRGLGARPSARFFSYGGPALSRINQHIEMRAEVSP
jgi:hypothetical protein